MTVKEDYSALTIIRYKTDNLFIGVLTFADMKMVVCGRGVRVHNRSYLNFRKLVFLLLATDGVIL